MPTLASEISTIQEFANKAFGFYLASLFGLEEVDGHYEDAVNYYCDVVFFKLTMFYFNPW